MNCWIRSRTVMRWCCTCLWLNLRMTHYGIDVLRGREPAMTKFVDRHGVVAGGLLQLNRLPCLAG